MSNELASAEQEAKVIVKGVEKVKVKVPKNEDNILNWSAAELKAYVDYKTFGLSWRKKVKFGKALLRRIEALKKAEAE